METLILLLIMIAGLMLHFLKKIRDLRSTGSTVTLIGYWTSNPYATCFSFLSAMTAFLLLYGSPELTRTAAFCIGFMCDSVASMFGQRGLEKISG